MGRRGDYQVICGACGCVTDRPHGDIIGCRAALLARLDEAQRRLTALRATSIKDQSGAVAAGEFLRARGLGTYTARETANTLANRVTQPITLEHFVETTQVAPTILKILGLDPNALEAVRKEGTPVLPGLHFKD